VLDPEFRKNVNGIVSNLNSTAGSVNDIIGSNEKDLKKAVADLTRFSGMLADNSPKISKAVTNLESISDTIAASDIYSSLADLKKTLEGTSGLLKNLNEGKGSAGQLLTDDSLYTNLSGTLQSLNLLLQDMKANPKKYVHFSLFGKKNIPSE